jgi:histone chaperone ASF1
MAKVHILNVTVHNNPATFYTPFQFEIHFECLEELQDDLEFKIIYVGSAETYEFDQCLDQIVVDAVPQGQFKFMFQADPPDTLKIPADDAVGVTVVLITASYREQEFVRVGYYVTNEYEDIEMRENPPSEPQFTKLIRTIAANEPRVTKFKINWESSAAAAAAAATTSSSNVEISQDDTSAAATNSTAAAAAANNMETNPSLFQSSNSNQLQSQQMPSQASNSDKLENKENILLQQQKTGFMSTDSKLNTESTTPSQNNLVESSYDSIMS